VPTLVAGIYGMSVCLVLYRNLRRRRWL
jgi:hypothetical protein